MRSRAAALAAVVVLSASPRALADDPANVTVARELFVEASQLAEQGRWEDARDRYERSLQLKRAAITYYSLGIAQMNTGQLVEALESLRAFLAEPSVDATRPYEEPARAAVAEIEKRVPRITVVIWPQGLPGLVVKIDGRDIPEAARGRPRPVNAGRHELTATAPGYLDANELVTVAEGGSATVVLSLEKAALAPRPAPRPAHPEVSAPVPSPDRTLPIALLGGGGAVFAAGVVVGMVGVAGALDAPTSDGPEASSARTKMLVGDIVGGAGLVAAGVGLVLLLTQDGDPPDPKAPVAGRWSAGRAGRIQLTF